MLPEPVANKHAKPFKGITPPTGDTFIVADISARKEVLMDQSEENKRLRRSSGFTLLRRHLEKWDRGGKMHDEANEV